MPVRTADKVKEQSKSPKTLEKSTPTTPTVAAIRRVVAEGGWVIMHGQCWKQGERKGKLVLVSDEEMENNGVFWRVLRGMTDQELQEKYDIVRGGSKRTVKRQARGTNVSEEEMEEAGRLYLAAREEAGDETSDEESTNSVSSPSDKEPDLRRRQRCLSSDEDTSDAAEGADENMKVAVDVIMCDEGHQTRKNTSDGVRACDRCEAKVPRYDQFFRCGEYDWNMCFDCDGVPR